MVFVFQSITSKESSHGHFFKRINVNGIKSYFRHEEMEMALLTSEMTYTQTRARARGPLQKCI